MPQRRMASAKIVERNAATRLAQRVDKAGRLLDVAKCRGFRYFDDQTTRDLRAVTQQRNQQLQPPSIASRQSRNVEPDPDLGIGGQFLNRLFEYIAVDEADQAEFFDDGDELGTSEYASFL